MSTEDCGRIQELLSALADGEGSAEERELVREHCARCPDCAALDGGLRRLAGIPRSAAPEGLAERILRAAEDERKAEPRDVPVPPPAAEPIPVPARPVTSLLRDREQAMLIVAGGLAAVLVAAAAGFAVLGAFRSGGEEGAQPAAEKESESSEDLGSAPPGGSAERSSQVTARLVSRDRLVYASIGTPGPLPQGATAGAPVYAAMDTTGQPSSRDTFETTAQPDVLFVESTEGAYEPFQLQSRSLDSRTYVLVTETPITVFGQWPALPGRFRPPQKPDGWPTFSATGLTDSSGAQVYAVAGSSPDLGFALPPGTASGPAAGAPVWTWWERRP